MALCSATHLINAEDPSSIRQPVHLASTCEVLGFCGRGLKCQIIEPLPLGGANSSPAATALTIDLSKPIVRSWPRKQSMSYSNAA